ncbi:MAG: helix-turn-helix transcriptional regulator [Acidiferrobacteraceae bacterium]
MQQQMQTGQTQGYLRMPQILALIPISRSSWWAGVRSGKYPRPIKLGPRTTAWRAADIQALIVKIDRGAV